MTTYRLRYIKNGTLVTKEFNMRLVTKEDEARYNKIFLEIQDAYDKGLVR